jgi:hypothetical protein
MQSRSGILVAGLALVTAIGIGACNRGDEGAAEHAGQQIDQAVQGAADAAGAAGDAAKQAGADAAGAVEDGAAAAEQKMQ